MMGMRRSDWEYSLLAVFLASAAPAVLMESWWSFVLSQVPLKADGARFRLTRTMADRACRT